MTNPILWARSIVQRRKLEREMQVEMEEHLARSTERLIRRGLSPSEARREALREFGNVTYLQEEGRIARGTVRVDEIVADLRFALRHFFRNPLSTLTSITVLAVGIAINVILFTLVYSFTERPPSGVEASDELVRIRGSQLGLDSRIARSFTLEELESYASLDDHFSAVGGWSSQAVTGSARGTDETTLVATFVTSNYFTLLGVRPVLGTGLDAGSDESAVILSHAAWSRLFAEDPGILGRMIELNGVPFTIVGIAPPRFRGAAWEARDDMQVWLPLAGQRHLYPRLDTPPEHFSAIARLKAGATLESATAAVSVVAGRFAERASRPPQQGPSSLGRDPSAEVVALLSDNLEPGFEAEARFVKMAFTVLGLLTLLVTCANISALQTGLALARRREIAIRMSLGARRGRLVRQLVTESLLLALLGGIAAVGVSLGALRVILAIVGSFSFEFAYDRTTLFFTFGIALAAGFLFGISPALHATRTAISGAIKDSAASVSGGRARLQRWLVVAQITLTQPLAVCVATLVVLGVFEYRSNPLTPRGDEIVVVRTTSADGVQDALPVERSDAVSAELETDRLLSSLREIPAVVSVVRLPGQTPFSRTPFSRIDSPQGDRPAEASSYLTGRAAHPGYLDIIGAPILLGRDLEAGDTAGFRAGAIPVVIGDDMARTFWREASPIGHRIRQVASSESAITLEVVGVYDQDIDATGDSRDNFAVYLPPDPRQQDLAASRVIMLRTSSPGEDVMPAIRQVVRDELPQAAVTEFGTLASREKDERSVLLGAIGLFSTGGIIVLFLSALGLYAVVAFAVGQRTREIAVRMAIGARTRRIIGDFASDGLRLTAIGIALGLPLSILGLHLLLSLSPDSPPVSLPLVMAVVGIGILAVSGIASWIPASRAAAVNPAVTLRRE